MINLEYWKTFISLVLYYIFIVVLTVYSIPEGFNYDGVFKDLGVISL